jgi:GTP-binding protein
LSEALLERTSFSALLLVVDARRGVGDLDLGLLAWANRPSNQVHVLLTKADKLARAQSMAALRQAREALTGRASVQLFSATKGTGLDEARAILRGLMNSGIEKINAPAE